MMTGESELPILMLYYDRIIKQDCYFVKCMYFVPLNEELEDRVRYMTIHIIDSCLKKYKSCIS